MVSEPDEETAFTLFHPVPLKTTIAANNGPRTVIARVCPNEDIILALEAICRKHDFAAAKLRGGIGSLIGARYADGSKVDDIATEVFVTRGFVTASQPGHVSKSSWSTPRAISHAARCCAVKTPSASHSSYAWKKPEDP